MITLSSLRPSAKRHHPKRVGRGNASGKGTTAGRGTKGQRARSGGRNKLIRRGMKHLIERTPKTRGFRSRRPKLNVVSVDRLAKTFNDNTVVTPRMMKHAGLIADITPGVKIVGATAIKKKLHIQAQRFTTQAAAAIRQAGGSASELTPRPTSTNPKKE